MLISGVRRKSGTLVPLELAICEAASVLRQRGTDAFHGYLIAKEVKHGGDARLLTAYGTLYRALGRLERMGLLSSVGKIRKFRGRKADPPDASMS
jgi:PadR family transcriptional regulator PadR